MRSLEDTFSIRSSSSLPLETMSTCLDPRFDLFAILPIYQKDTLKMTSIVCGKYNT